MAEAIVVTERVRVPARAITVRAVRSSGPGGQNVNKVASKVDLRVDLRAIEGLPESALRRLEALASRRLDAQGRLVVTSQATRDQSRNLDDARSRVRALVAAALREPRVRRPTRPGLQAEERRIGAKKRRATVKRLRGRPVGDD
ncbi:MAG TPA: alternative ribosome rescue aminoacyl-tRNA hydrolase ArfB [Methylomirabilota bacterium]|nr:alternative ribosome rescue aminoacyl-tRNA hydrolase ArfB [Methylomirabilota bacterium]